MNPQARRSPRPRSRSRPRSARTASGSARRRFARRPARACSAPRDHASRRRPQARGRGGRARASRRWAICSGTFPTPTASGRAASARGAAAGGGGDDPGRGALGPRAAHPPAQPDDRRGDRRGRSPARPRRSGSTRPGWRSGCGRGRGCCCRGSSTAPGFGSRRTSSLAGRHGRAAPGSTRPGSCRSTRSRSGSVPSACANGSGRPAAWPPTRSRPCPPSCAPAAGCRAPATRWRSPTSPTAAKRGRAVARTAGLRGASAAPGGARGAAPRSRGDAGRRWRSDPPGELSRAWVESLPFELTGEQRSARSGDRCGPRRRAPDAAAADG